MNVTGVLHMHSTHSYDGKLSLRELKSFLLERGVQFACMTEHTDYLDKAAADAFVAECRALSDDQFVFVPGFEVPYKDAHVLHIGATEFISSIANAAQLALWRKVTPLMVLAHPVRNKFIVDEHLRSMLDGVEVWNQQYDGKVVPRVRAVKLLAELRATHPRLLATGGLDFHRLEHFGAPLVHMDTPKLTVGAIVGALKEGLYTFGNDQALFIATTSLDLTKQQVFASRVSTVVIALGKSVTATLARVGLRLPKRWARAIRGRL